MGTEKVDHPSHYGGGDNPHEHVKCAEAWGLVSNAFLYNCTKYICRVGKKEGADQVEDLRKAEWYLHRGVLWLQSSRHRATTVLRTDFPCGLCAQVIRAGESSVILNDRVHSTMAHPKCAEEELARG